MARIVLALGGNALGNTPKEQMQLIQQTAEALAGLIEAGHQVVLTHGNGPQVGMIEKGLSFAAAAGETAAFLNDLPHRYFDENQLHAFMLSEMRDFDRCMDGVRRFLPYVDNWATCDQMSPKVFKRHRAQLPGNVREWLASGHTYTVRFAIGMLMAHFLDEDFDEEYPRWVSQVRSDDYYVNMMIAWYFATALAKRYEAVLPYIEERRLPPWTHNKAIQKSLESYRIPDERKAYLKGLKIR